MTVTVQLFTEKIDGEVFGLSMVTQPRNEADTANAVSATRGLAEDLVDIAVPQSWRGPTIEWVRAHIPDGGRTSNVPGAGITAGVAPLAGAQWYVELYELDGLER